MCVLPESLLLLRDTGWDAGHQSAQAESWSMQDPATAGGAQRELRTM